jgi:hypothetical protein
MPSRDGVVVRASLGDNSTYSAVEDSHVQMVHMAQLHCILNPAVKLAETFLSNSVFRDDDKAAYALGKWGRVVEARAMNRTSPR